MGPGSTAVTVRIFIRGELVHEASLSGLQRCQLWEVAEVDWSDLSVRPVTTESGGNKIGRRCSEDTDYVTGF